MIDESRSLEKIINGNLEINQAYRSWSQMKFNFDPEFIDEFEKTINDKPVTCFQ